MVNLTIGEIAQATSGAASGFNDRSIGKVTVDSRKVIKGDLFIALAGSNHDGHDFLTAAKDAGAVAAVVCAKSPKARRFHELHSRFPLVFVNDPVRALGEIARLVREKAGPVTVGITGTTGKTSTKDYLVSILGTRGDVAFTRGNRNNEIGLPLTILEMKKNDRMLVVEMGARHPGDIRWLSSIAKPGLGIITNVGPGHLELFKDEETVALTKAELAEDLPQGGTLVLNGDDQWSRRIARLTRADVIRFGTGRKADFRAVRIALDREGRPTFAISSGEGTTEPIRLRGPGRHQVWNALAAAACAASVGYSMAEIISGLEDAELTPMRMEVVDTGKLTVINDAYNANPVSMRAALKSLSEIAGKRRTIAVLGGMRELGRSSKNYHEEIGALLVERDIDLLVTVGRAARSYASAALSDGMPRGSVFRSDSAGEAVSVLGDILESDDVVLVKASRAYELETVVEALIEPDENKAKMVANV